jgi:hypothetical protein
MWVMDCGNASVLYACMPLAFWECMSHEKERSRRQSAALLLATVAAATAAAMSAAAHGVITPQVMDLAIFVTAIAGSGAGWGITR